jgi:predicted DNA-binding transcriptional regulator AlpA
MERKGMVAMGTAPSDKPWMDVAPTGRMLRPDEVIARVGLSRSQVYQMIAEQRFPPFVKLSIRASAMPEAWLNAFISCRANHAMAALQR